MLMTLRSLVTLSRMMTLRSLVTLSRMMTLRSLVALSRMMKQHQIHHPQMLSPNPRRPRLEMPRGLKGVSGGVGLVLSLAIILDFWQVLSVMLTSNNLLIS